MKRYFFTIEGRPKPKQSTRLSSRFGVKRFHSDKKVKSYESSAQMIIKTKFREAMIKEPVKLEVKAYFGIPKNTKKSEKISLINAPYPKKPDGDNLLKMICDILKGIVIEDDNLITSKSIDKLYGETSRTEIYLSRI